MKLVKESLLHDAIHLAAVMEHRAVKAEKALAEIVKNMKLAQRAIELGHDKALAFQVADAIYIATKE